MFIPIDHWSCLLCRPWRCNPNANQPSLGQLPLTMARAESIITLPKHSLPPLMVLVSTCAPKLETLSSSTSPFSLPRPPLPVGLPTATVYLPNICLNQQSHRLALSAISQDFRCLLNGSSYQSDSKLVSSHLDTPGILSPPFLLHLTNPLPLPAWAKWHFLAPSSSPTSFSKNEQFPLLHSLCYFFPLFDYITLILFLLWFDV